MTPCKEHDFKPYCAIVGGTVVRCTKCLFTILGEWSGMRRDLPGARHRALDLNPMKDVIFEYVDGTFRFYPGYKYLSPIIKAERDSI